MTDTAQEVLTQQPFESARPIPEQTALDLGDEVSRYNYSQAFKPAPSFMDKLHSAVDLESTIANHFTSNQIHKIDPDFVQTKELMDQYGKGMPDSVKETLLGAQSEEHMADIRAHAEHEMKNEENTSDFSGTMLKLGVAITDPISIAAMAATSGGGALMKGGRIARMLSSGAIFGTAATAQEAYLQHKQLAREDNTAFYGAMGLGLGALGGAFTKEAQVAIRGNAHKAADAMVLDEVAKEGKPFGLEVNKVKRTIDGVSEETHYSQKITDTLVKDAFQGNMKDVPPGVPSLARHMLDNGSSRSEVSAVLKGGDPEKVSKVVKMITTDMAHAQHAEGAAAQKAAAVVAKYTEAEAAWAAHEKAVTAAKIAHEDEVSKTMQEVFHGDDGLTREQRMEKLVEQEGSAGSAQVTGATVEMDSPSKFLHIPIPGTDFKIPIRHDLFSIFARQNNPIYQKLNSILHPDSVGGYNIGINAMEFANMKHKEWMGEFKEAAWDAWTKYKLDNPVPLLRRGSHHNKFMELATAAKRNPDLETHPAIRQLANDMHRIEAKAVAEAQRHGVEGAEDVEAALHYITRKFSQNNRLKKLAELEDVLGNDVAAKSAMIKTLSGALMSGQVKLTELKADAIAAAYYKTTIHLPYDKSLQGVMGVREYGLLRESLKKLNISPTEIEDVMELITGRPHDPEASAKGVIPRFKRRTLMDENFEMTFDGVREGEKVTVKVSDLFENNAGKLMNSYLTQLSGASGLAKVGIKSRADWDLLQDKAARWAEEHPISPETHAKHHQYMEDTYKTLMGTPLEDNPGSVTNRSLKIMRDYNFFRLMGQAGFAQIAEIGNTLGYVGHEIFSQHIPSYGEMLKILKGGQASATQLDRDVNMMFHAATDMLDSPEITSMSDVSFHKGLTAAENVTNVGKWTTSRVSGMASINNFLHQISYKMVMAKIVDHAIGVEGLTEVQLRKLATAGLHGKDLKELSGTLKKFTTRDEKGKLLGIDYEGFGRHNPDLYDKFKIAVHREARRAVQQQLRGENHPWMHTLLGQNLMQFRSFVMAAHGKQLLWGLSHMDRHTAMMWAYSSMLGGLAYTAQTSLNFAGNQEELDKRLSGSSIAKAAFMRTGASSLLPGLIDTGAAFTSGEPLFRYGRSTDQDTNLITGSPVYSLGTNTANGVKRMSRSVFDNEYHATKTDVKQGLNIVLPNYLVVRNFINAVSDHYPKKNPTNQPVD